MGKWTDKWSDSDDTHSNWGRSNESRADDWSSKTGSDSHCHLWVDKSKGETGVVHRGDCKVCDDQGSGGGFLDWLLR